MIDPATRHRGSDSPKKAPWDQRLLGGMARESWEAANNPEGRLPNPKLREQARSPYFWLQLPIVAGILLALYVIKTDWADALAAVLYVAGLIAGQLARRDARAVSLLRTPTEEPT